MATLNKSLLWNISIGDSLPPSYLFGTMHVRDERVFKWIDQLEKLIEEVEGFAAEFPLSENEVQSVALLNEQLFFFPLKQKLGLRQFEKLNTIFLKSFGIDMNAMGFTHPMLIINKLSESVLSPGSKISLDEHLWQTAASKHKNLLGVESFETQCQILSKLDINNQLKSLKSIGRNVKKFKHQILKLIEHYEDQNIKQLYISSKNSLGKDRKVLLYNRNVAMARKISTLVSNQSCFVAIGAAHLYGEKGVLRLLRQNGIKLEKLTLL